MLPVVSNRKPAKPVQVHRETLFVLYFMCMIRGADLQLLPSSFRAMEVDLDLRPYYLGILALCQGVACSMSGPLWGNLVDCGFSRISLLMLGTAIWGVCTMALGQVANFHGMAVLRACNGVALACLMPITQSFVAEMADGSNRGAIFGWLYLFSHVGQVFATLFATPLSNQQVLGMAGWRVALLVVGAATLLSVPLIPVMMKEERHAFRPERFGAAVELRKLWKFMQIRTFIVILAQGVFGTIPGAALSFVTMYVQYTGVSDSTAAMINALSIVGSALGGLMGGFIGDALHHRNPVYGRPLTAQLSVLGCIPCVFMMFYVLKPTEANIGLLAGVLFLHGLLGSWVAPGCICPVICDIVSKRCLASAYAWELAIVFASGNALGPMTIGYLSQRHYGYRWNDAQVVDMSPELRANNAQALASSLLVACTLPYAICALLLTMMYFTYRGDTREASFEDASGESDAVWEETPLRRSVLSAPEAQTAGAASELLLHRRAAAGGAAAAAG